MFISSSDNFTQKYTNPANPVRAISFKNKWGMGRRKNYIPIGGGHTGN